MKKVVVFDLDDTLYKEIDFLKSAYKEIASVLEERYLLKGVYNHLWNTYRDGMNVFQSINSKFGIDVPLSDYLTIYRNHVPQLTLSSNTCIVLELLSLEGVELGVLTDGRTITQRNKMRALGLDKYIPVENWAISEVLGCEKPSLEGYLFFQNKYSDETSFYYVGDNTAKDFEAPNKLGWINLCLLDDGRNIHKQNFDQPGDRLPTYVIKDMLELLEYI